MENYNNNLNVPQQPNYYSVIPAEVRYSKNLSFSAKIVYSELEALTNLHGYCFCTNEYLARLFNLNIRQVQRIIRSLCENGHITIEMDQNYKRKIYTITKIKVTKKELFDFDWLNEEE